MNPLTLLMFLINRFFVVSLRKRLTRNTDHSQRSLTLMLPSGAEALRETLQKRSSRISVIGLPEYFVGAVVR